MKPAINYKKTALTTLLILIIITAIYEYKQAKSAVKNDKTPGMSSAKPASGISSRQADDKSNEVTSTVRSDKPFLSKGDSLIEGVVVSKEELSWENNSSKTQKYFLFLRDTSGRLRKFGTTESNYTMVKKGDHIFYRYTSGKNYKLVISPDKM